MFLALPNKSLSKITGFLLFVTQFHFQRIYNSQQRLGFLFVQLVGFLTIRQTSVYFCEKKKIFICLCKLQFKQESLGEAFQEECCLQDFQLHKGKGKKDKAVGFDTKLYEEKVRICHLDYMFVVSPAVSSLTEYISQPLWFTLNVTPSVMKETSITHYGGFQQCRFMTP